MPPVASAIIIPTTGDSQPLRVYLPMNSRQRSVVSDILQSSNPFAIAVAEGGYRTVPVELVLLPSLEESTDNLTQNSDSEFSSETDSVLSGSTSDSDYDPETLDEPTHHKFEVGEPAWIKSVMGNWILGEVTSRQPRLASSRTDKKLECVYYPVVYRHYVKLRRYFSPTNGDIKPDTPRVRELLREGGWLSKNNPRN